MDHPKYLRHPKFHGDKYQYSYIFENNCPHSDPFYHDICPYTCDEGLYSCCTCSKPTYSLEGVDKKPKKIKKLFQLKFNKKENKMDDNFSEKDKYYLKFKSRSIDNPNGHKNSYMSAPCTVKMSYKQSPEFKSYTNYPIPIEDDNATNFKNEMPTQMDWKNYHRLKTIHEFMDDLESDFPSICTTGIIGQSLENRDLKVLRISNSHANNTSIWLDAGIHAREWIAPAVATYVADNIARQFNYLPEYMTNKDWYFLPVMNPDGYEYSHTNERMWRKNKAWCGGRLVGVDLNRNFSCGWGGKGSSDDPKNAFFRGPEPFSEPESRAVRRHLFYIHAFLHTQHINPWHFSMATSLATVFKGKFVFGTSSSIGFYFVFGNRFQSLHHSAQLRRGDFVPLSHRDELAPDYIRLLEGATVMSRAIHDSNGNTYKVGISRDVMYGAAGTSNDWSYGSAGIPYCYLIELRSKKYKFRLPQEEIEETGNEILNCVTALMEHFDQHRLELFNKNNQFPESDFQNR